MAVDLHTKGDTQLPQQGQDTNIIHPTSQDHNHSIYINPSSASKPHQHTTSSLLHSTEVQGKERDDDFTAELTRQMAHFMLQDEDKYDFSAIASQNLETSCDSIGSPHWTLWSSLGSNQGSPEGFSQEPSPPAVSGTSHDFCWESTYDVVGMFEKMKLEGRENSKYHPCHMTHSHSLNTSNVELCSYQSLIQDQIRATQLYRLKQEKILSMKQKLPSYRETDGQIFDQYEPHHEQILQFQKKGKRVAIGCGNGQKTHLPPPAPLQYQQSGSDMRALFLGGSGSRGTSCGTGVFLPRGGTSVPFESRKRPGKGSSTILIPARVVQALQLHFDQMAATSGPKAGGFPPLHDVLVSNKDGMYSLQKRQSRKAPASIRNEMILPQEWTY